MALFYNIVFNSEKPVYLQIIEYIKKQILLDKIKDRDEMPSRREVASTLGINPNTVQKAFKELENEGIISTSSNAKSIITVNEEIKQRIASELKNEATVKYVKYIKSMNLSFKEAIELITDLWD